MSLKRLSVRLWLAIVIVGGAIALLLGTPAKGEEVGEDNKNIPQLSEVEVPVTNAQTLAQTPLDPSSAPPNQGEKGGVVSITQVVANPTDKGIEIILQTTKGQVLQPVTLALGRTYIANIPNAVLALPQGEFRQDNPASGITRVAVTQATANSIRVAVTGETALPQVQLYDAPEEGVIFSFTPGTSAAQTPPAPEGETQPGKPLADEQEIVVTGEQDGYNVPNASTATRTDTPLRDIPQSIQVVPQEVLRDRKPRNLSEAVETVSGVVEYGNNFGTPAGGRIIRGFAQEGNNYRNGYRDTDFYSLTGIGTIEQVEVLKGPASVLFGAVEPGGIVNVITKQPLSEPYYNLEFEAGNRNFYQPSLDFSGPLNADETLLYRLIGSYQSADGFQDFVTSDLTTIAPSLTWKLGDRTTLNLYYEYIRSEVDPVEGRLIVFSDNTFRLPRDRYLGYPDLNFIETTTQKTGYTLNHQFNDNWQIRNALAVVFNTVNENFTEFTDLVDDRFLEGDIVPRDYSIDNYFGQIDLLGKFKTGTISHQLLVGFDVNRNVEHFEATQGAIPGALDVFNPNYDTSDYEFVPDSSFSFYEPIQSYGVYLQDQIGLLDNLKLLVGGRVDWVERINDVVGEPTTEQNDSAFSPRIGLVYQPSESVALYTSYSRSFTPTFGFNPDGRAFEPTKGTQYEAGIKADFLEGRLSTTLAAYQITKTNVSTPDPENTLFSIQVGEQRSRGIELDIAGEILPGWNVIGSYAYTDAETTKDNAIAVGNRLPNVPENQASLWTTYEIQKGDFKGLGFGLGLFYVGTRAGDLDNSFEIPDYFRTDAAIYYRKDGFNAAINIRNLFDTFYYRNSIPPGRFTVNPGAPFTITGSISWEF